MFIPQIWKDHDLTLDTTFSDKSTGDQGGDGVFGEFWGLS